MSNGDEWHDAHGHVKPHSGAERLPGGKVRLRSGRVVDQSTYDRFAGPLDVTVVAGPRKTALVFVLDQYGLPWTWETPEPILEARLRAFDDRVYRQFLRDHPPDRGNAANAPATTWEAALDKYRYPVDLREFGETSPGWFELHLDRGDWAQTSAFEARFRREAPYCLEAWAEVLYWKLYFRRGIARKRATELLRSRRTARDLWSLCGVYIEERDRRSFSAFRKMLFPSKVVAAAATFPAFIRPDVFPMVDTQIAEWIRSHGRAHAFPGSVTDVPEGNIEERHWCFVEDWIRWCRSTADRLGLQTGRTWRPRDVEMAVFSAQRGDGPELEPLT